MSGMRAFRLALASIVILLLMIAVLVSVTTISASAAARVNAPSNTNAVAVSESQTDVNWQDNSRNETGFEVHRSTTGQDGAFSLRAATGANATHYTDEGLAPSTQYCYKVRAVKTSGGRTSYSEFSITACATTSAPPPLPQPGSIRVTTATTGSDLDPDGYFVRVDGGPDQLIGTNATITITGVAAGDHTLSLSHVAPNCAVDGANPRTVSVTSEATTEITFAVTCGPSCVPTSATDVCGNGIDDDCDGLVDVFDPDCACDVQECYSEVCPAGYVCGFDGCCVPHCFDGQRDGDEGDVDCGGSCAAKCAPGQHCYGFWDCASGVCVNDICQ
jgi:hypothetical protein